MEYDVTVVDGKYLIDGALLQTLDLTKEKRIDLINQIAVTRRIYYFPKPWMAQNIPKMLSPLAHLELTDAFSQISIPFKAPDLYNL